MTILVILATIDGQKKTYGASSYVEAYEYLSAHDPATTSISFQRTTRGGEHRSIHGKLQRVKHDAIQWLIEAEADELGTDATIAVREAQHQQVTQQRLDDEDVRLRERYQAARHTREELSTFLDELRILCEKHDMCLVGTGEGVYQQISLGRLSNPDALMWSGGHPYDLTDEDRDYTIQGYFPRLPRRM